MTYPAPYKLLCYLNDSTWIPGPILAKQLGITRSAIWKHIKFLQSKGIAIEHGHRGYRLKDSLILLNKDRINDGIDIKWQQAGLNLSILPAIHSTNTYAKQLAKTGSWTLCLSEQQTAGRGRLGRPWSSPFGENMYLSIAWRTSESLAKLSGLSIAASLALSGALSPWISSLQVKWPNDLLWQGKKLAGCLVEVSAETHGSSLIVVGIGLNINTQTDITPLSHHPHCSMRDILNHRLNRNEIIIAAINHCLQSFKQFEHHGLAPLLNTWQRSDYLYNQQITVYQSQQTLQGTAKGINAFGHLLIEKEDGSIAEVSSGEASLSPTITTHPHTAQGGVWG